MKVLKLKISLKKYNICLFNSFIKTNLYFNNNYFCFCENKLIPNNIIVSDYSKEILNHLKINKFTDIQYKTFQSLSKYTNKINTNNISNTNEFNSENYKNHTLLLNDDLSGKYFAVMFSIINNILLEKENRIKSSINESFDTNELLYNKKVLKKNDDFFLTVDKVLEKIQDNKVLNLEKKFLKPHGALIISPKFEFSSQLYKIGRKIDFKNKLKMTRIGTTLQNISPVIEHLDNETEANESELEEICKINLLLNTIWDNNDIMFISPVMMEFVMNNLDEFDKYDINPSIIYIDDYDYLLSNKEMHKICNKIIHKYFSPNSDFNTSVNSLTNNKEDYSRSLILSSSSFNEFKEFNTYKKYVDNFDIQNSSSYLSNLSKKSIEKIIGECLESNNKFKFDNFISSNNYMDFSNYHTTKGIINYLFYPSEDALIGQNNITKFNIKTDSSNNSSNAIKTEKKIKKLFPIINTKDLSKKFIICVNSDKNLKQVKDDLKKRKVNFTIIEKDCKVNERLKALVEFNSGISNVLLGGCSFIKGLNFSNVDNIIFYDLVDDCRDILRLLSKLRINVIGRKNSCHIIYNLSEEHIVSNLKNILVN